MRLVPVVLLCLSSAGLSNAGIIFFINDQPGFNLQAGSLLLRGIEDFESSTLGPNQITILPDPLAPGVANNPFPTGTNPATGLTVQSNTLGGSASAPSPRGSNGLATASAGFLSTPSDQISNNSPQDSFDMLFALPSGAGVRAVSFIPLFFPDSGFATGTITIQAYGPLNTLLSSTTITGVDYVNAGSFVGIIATGADTIVRINLWDGSTGSNYQGADDIAVYSDIEAVPEPSTLLLSGLGMLLAIGWLRALRH